MINKVIHDDCLNISNYINGRCIDLIITSPPYNIDLGRNKSQKPSRRRQYDEHEDNMPYGVYLDFLYQRLSCLIKHLKEGARVCINIGDGNNGEVPTKYHLDDMMIRGFKLLPFTTIIWRKKQVSNRCLLPDELINTKNGYKSIKDIRIGDYVLTHKGRYKKVLHTFKNKYTGYLYTIKSSSGEPIKITEKHHLYATPILRKWKGKGSPYKRVRHNYQWLTPECLNTKYYLSIPKYTTQYHASIKAFNNRMTKLTGHAINYYDKDFFRLLGYYIGDGSIHNYAVRIDFGLNEQSYCKDIEKICQKYQWSFNYEKRDNLNRIEINSHNTLPNILYNLCGQYAHNKHIHPFLIQSPYSLQKELIKGLIRSDGHISVNDMSYTSVSPQLCYQIRDILLRLGIGSTVDKRKEKSSIIKERIIKASKSYVVRIYGSHISKLYKILNLQENHNKKYRYSKTKVSSYSAFYKIKKITKKYVNDIDVYNIEVEDDQSYVGKVTYHNCAWGSWMSPSKPSFPRPWEYISVYGYKTLKKPGDKKLITISGEEFTKFAYGEWEFSGIHDPDHPSPFPPELPYRCIQMFSYKGDLVLDPFCGTGAALIEAKRTGRSYLGFDISAKYVKIALERLKNI